MYEAYHSGQYMSIGYIKIMTCVIISKMIYMTQKTSLFEYVVRVYPIETKKEGGGGIQRQSVGALFFLKHT